MNWVCSGVAAAIPKIPIKAGSAISSNSQVCNGVNFTLSLSGADTGIVISYQWQSSADNLNWNNIPGAVSPTLSTNLSSATYYRSVLSCSGFSSNSASVLIGLNPALLCYCSTNLGGATCPSTDFIRNVTIVGTTLNNSDTICNYNNNSCLSVFSPAGSATAVLTRGSTYSLSVTTSSNNIISIWIDYDQNGLFEPHEWKQIATSSVAGVANIINLDIPWGIPGGQTGMRVRSRVATAQNDSSSSCLNFGSGETEDYIVTIDIGTAISSPVKETILNVVPNPATTTLIISFVNYTSENAALNLRNMNGQVVYTEKISQPAGNYSKTLDVSSFAKGIYNLQLISKSGIINKKVVIE